MSTAQCIGMLHNRIRFDMDIRRPVKKSVSYRIRHGMCDMITFGWELDGSIR